MKMLHTCIHTTTDCFLAIENLELKFVLEDIGMKSYLFKIKLVSTAVEC